MAENIAPSKVTQGFYSLFKKWFENKYGWFQSLAIPKNDYTSLMSNPYFQNFITEERWEYKFPEARRKMEEASQTTQPTGQVYGPAVPEGWAPQGEDEFAEQRRMAEAMGVSLEDFFRSQYGLPTSFDLERPEEGITPWQQSQIEAQRQQLQLQSTEQMNQQLRSQWDIEARQLDKEYQWMNQMMGAGTGQTPGDRAVAEREQQAKEWDFWHKQATAGATNWVEKQNIGLQTNPYKDDVGQMNMDEYVREVKNELQAAEDFQKLVQKRAADPKDRLYNEDQVVRTADAWVAGMRSQLTKVGEERAREYASNYYPGGERKDEPAPRLPQQKGVAAPSWLREFATGLGEYIPGTGNVPGTAPKIGTPTMQQFRGLGTERAEELAGYAKWTGQDIGSIYARVQSMLPRDPSFSRRWSPSMQV